MAFTVIVAQLELSRQILVHFHHVFDLILDAGGDGQQIGFLLLQFVALLGVFLVVSFVEYALVLHLLQTVTDQIFL